MNEEYLLELKKFADLHIKSQNLKHVAPLDVLNRITSYDNDNEGSWEFEWMEEGDRVIESAPLEAIQCYNFARFPYAKTELQKEGHHKLTVCFRNELINAGIQKEYLSFENHEFAVYTSSLSQEKPLMIVMGGIVSIKEQWYKFLKLGPKLGFSVIVTEFPKVGENQLAFNPEAYKMILKILDYFKDQVDVDNTYYVGMSFGGQLGIQCALHDDRIKGITTVGAPLYHFYHMGKKQWENLPFITKQTLSHVCDTPELLLHKRLTSFSIDETALSKLSTPITYIFSLKDEIIPINELEFLQKYMKNLNLITFKDVHGSPNHMDEIQKLIPLNLLKQQKSNLVHVKVMLDFALRIAQGKQRLKKFISTGGSS